MKTSFQKVLETLSDDVLKKAHFYSINNLDQKEIIKKFRDSGKNIYACDVDYYELDYESNNDFPVYEDDTVGSFDINLNLIKVKDSESITVTFRFDFNQDGTEYGNMDIDYLNEYFGIQVFKDLDIPETFESWVALAEFINKLYIYFEEFKLELIKACGE